MKKNYFVYNSKVLGRYISQIEHFKSILQYQVLIYALHAISRWFSSCLKQIKMLKTQGKHLCVSFEFPSAVRSATWCTHLYIINADLSIVFLSLQLQFNVEKGYLWTVVLLWLHLETGITESLLKCDTHDEL